MFNLPESNIPNCYFFSISVINVALYLAEEGEFLELDPEEKLQPVSQ